MDRSFLLFGVVVMLLLWTCITASDDSNSSDHDIHKFLPVRDIVIDTIHGFLQDQGKRLATFRQYIADYSKKHQEQTDESSIIDDEEVKEEAEQGQYFSPAELELCRGGIRQSAGIQKKLKCRYVDLGNPFLKIAPFKEEEIYLEPRIVIYHKVIYDEEINTFMKLAKPRLRTANVTVALTGGQMVSKFRISKLAWIKEVEDTNVKLLNRRLGHMTGLTIDTAENFQVAYYDIGGLFLPHEDFFENVKHLKTNTGNRISTVLFYMNDVEEGGATIFPLLDIAIRPRKGSALFWYNLKQNGRGDYFTKHAACPVLAGTKWIVTKWFREKGQEFLRPCPLFKNGMNHQ